MMRCAVIAGVLAAAPAGAQGDAPWISSTERDPFDDTLVVSASAYAEDGTAIITVNCQIPADGGAPYAAMGLGGLEHQGREDNRLIEVRYGDGEPMIDTVDVMDGTALLAGGEVAEPYIRLFNLMSRHDRIRYRYSDWRGVRHTVSFSLEGAPEAVGRVVEACGWPPAPE